MLTIFLIFLVAALAIIGGWFEILFAGVLNKKNPKPIRWVSLVILIGYTFQIIFMITQIAK